jgi:exopolyphosphatase/guanosine-5'-triphosphate,3'-diphosphate pyrophosphatase
MSISTRDFEAVNAVMRSLDLEPEHPLQVRRTAIELFDALQDLHGLGGDARERLEAAALLHDVGYRQGVRKHHKSARTIIMNLNLPGFSETDQRVVACIARYHRRSEPKPDHKIYGDLEPEEQAEVRCLAAILRIADGLDRLHIASVQSLRVERDDPTVRILLHQRRPCPTDIWGGIRKSAMFANVFGLQVDIAVDVG